MCGFIGVITIRSSVNFHKPKMLIIQSRQRGRDSSGLLYLENDKYSVVRADFDIKKLLHKVNLKNAPIVLGHSRLITNGLADNQPVIRDNMVAVHNGIIVNNDEVWSELTVERKYQIDSEVIVAIAEECLANNVSIEKISSKILNLCKGIVACALLLSRLGKLFLFSNNGSLYLGEKEGTKYFASKKYALQLIHCDNIEKIKEAQNIDIPYTPANIPNPKEELFYIVDPYRRKHGNEYYQYY